MAKHLAVGLILLVVVSLSIPGSAQWQYFGEIMLTTDTPNIANPISLAADDSRNTLYIGTFNFTGAATDTYVVRFIPQTSNPLNGTFQQILSRSADNGRGISGLAYDATNDLLYVSGDSSSGVMYVDRIQAPHTGASPTIETDWLVPSFRTVGCDLADDSGTLYLLLADLNGPASVHSFNTSTKAEVTPAAALSGNYARDLVVDPVTNDIYLQRNGSLQQITGGSPGTMSGYGAGTDVISAANPATMEFSSGCYLSYTDIILGSRQVIWNNGDGGSGGDTLYVTYLDGTFDKDESLTPSGSSFDTAWQFACDSAAIQIGNFVYLYVADLDAGSPRLVVFRQDAATPVEDWKEY